MSKNLSLKTSQTPSKIRRRLFNSQAINGLILISITTVKMTMMHLKRITKQMKFKNYRNNNLPKFNGARP